MNRWSSSAEPLRARWPTVTALAIGLAVSISTTAGPIPAQASIAIRTPDGGTIRADQYGTGRRAVILAPGGQFDRSSWKSQANALAAAGFRVLAIDFRAAVEARAGGESTCLYDPICLAPDILAAVLHLREQGADSVYVIGASLGGGAAAQASVDAAPGDISGIVLLAAIPIGSPEKMRGRKLFITSRDDPGPSGVPRLVGIRKQYAAAPEPKELVVLDGAAHAQHIFATEQGPALMRAIVRFLSPQR